MIKSLIVVASTFLLLSSVYAAEPRMQTRMKGDTQIALNGHYWNSLDNKSKLVYVLAFEEGAFSLGTMLSSIEDPVSKEDRARLDKIVSDKISTKKTAGEVVTFIDKFYLDPMNLSIPVHFARTVFCLQQQGAGKTDEMIQMLRINSEPVNE